MKNVSALIEGLRGSASTFEKAWQMIVLDVACGQTVEIQAERPRLLERLVVRLELLKRIHALASRLRKLHGQDSLLDPDVLLAEIVGMDRWKTSVFDRWQTVEDLEDLAARDYPLTTADLDQMGPSRRPPHTWYAEEGKPF